MAVIVFFVQIKKKLTKQLYKVWLTLVKNGNSEKSKTSEAHRFKLDLADKLNLKNPKKKIALANLSIYYTWKNIKSSQNITTINLKFQHQLWMILLIYLMVLAQFLTFRIILNLSSKTWNFDWKPTGLNLSKENKKQNCFQNKNWVWIRIVNSWNN